MDKMGSNQDQDFAVTITVRDLLKHLTKRIDHLKANDNTTEAVYLGETKYWLERELNLMQTEAPKWMGEWEAKLLQAKPGGFAFANTGASHNEWTKELEYDWSFL